MNLFSIMQHPSHCIYAILQKLKEYSMNLRSKCHSFELPHYQYGLFRKSFVPTFVWNYTIAADHNVVFLFTDHIMRDSSMQFILSATNVSKYNLVHFRSVGLCNVFVDGCNNVLAIQCDSLRRRNRREAHWISSAWITFRFSTSPHSTNTPVQRLHAFPWCSVSFDVSFTPYCSYWLERDD